MPEITAEKCLRDTIPDLELFELYWNGNGNNSVCFRSIVENESGGQEQREYLISSYKGA